MGQNVRPCTIGSDWVGFPLLRRPQDPSAAGLQRAPRVAPLDILGALVVAAALVAVCATFRSYGIAWDEQGETVYGELLLRYYSSGFRDHAAFEFVNFRYYGGGVELPAAILQRLSPFDAYATP